MSHGAPINTVVPPRLSVQTASPQTAGPSSSNTSSAGVGSGTGSLGRRPMGARRRGVAAGLYVANPDNSDEDGASPVRTSPVTASSTSSAGDQYRGLPTIPQGNTPPPPGVHSTSTPNLLAPNATPPLPPPQPDRHLARRAFTSPVPPPLDQQQQQQQGQGHASHGSRPMEVRHGSLGGGGGGSHLGHTHTQQQSQQQQPPASPSRAARPALPSPPMQQSSPPPIHSASSGGSGHDSRPLPPNPQRMSSPEEVLSPVTEGSGRMRAGSFNNTTKRRLQVTTDNEQFTLVDITGMNTAEAIRDRIFSKLRFRDDEYPNLSLQRTEYGEDPDPRTVSHDELCQLCYSLSDHKANLKFLVVQGVPSSSAAVVPPADTSGQSFADTATGTAQRHSHASSSVGSSSFVHTPPQSSHTSLPSSAGGAGSSSQRMSDTSFLPQAGSSRRTSVLGLDMQSGSDEMDQATRDLIAQLQREDEEEAMREEARRRQLQADEELARKEQQSEAQEWHALQEEQEIRARQQRDQILRDEHRAREIAAEERRIEQESTYRPGDRSQEGTYRSSQDGGTYRPDRRNTYDREQEFANERRNRREQWSQTGRMARGGEEHQYPSVNPIFSGTAPAPPAFPSPPATYGQDAYQQDAFQQEQANYSAPTGFHRGYSESAHAQGRLTDHQLQEVQGRRNTAGGGPSRRPLHPYAYTAQEAPGARSVENLAGHGRPAYSNVLPPARGSLTPQPNDVRSFPPQPAMYRSPSAEHAQDGRYPDPARTSSIPFPSPQPRGSGVYDSPPLSSGGIRRSGSRPSSLHDETGSSGSGLPRRPNTLHDHSPPHIDGYQWQPRSASATSSANADYSTGSPTSSGPERLPYERSHTDSWLAVPGRHDSSDTASSSGMSEATVNPRRESIEDENSNDTAKPRDWQAVMGDLIASAKGPAAAGGGGGDDDEEATLFLPSSSSAPTTLRRAGAARSPPPKPLLTVDTRTNSPAQPTTDSATDSEGETAGGGRVQRGKSFARPDPGQWHTRPEPAQLYDRLDKYFPKVDLDQPIVDGSGGGGGSTPSTPGETPSTAIAGNTHGMPPPPVHPTRAPAAAAAGYDGQHLSPRTETIPRAPPTHPARSAFNKAENRKSIRVMADHKRKTLARNGNNGEPKEASSSSSSSAAQGKDEMKLSRRMSMWGHRVVEVTASKLNLGQLPLPATPGSPADGASGGTGEEEDPKEPQTLNWVKGELIGKGSYGRVYIALNISTGDMMAVKQVELPATERDRNDRKQLGQIESLRQEIALLKDMYHPNIVAYLGFETSPEYLSIFLEYVPGGTIATIYRTPNQARFEAELVKYFSKQILEGLAYLHQKHIWHRDLKGDNILVDLNGICKISDFGISKQTADAYDSFGQATNMKGSVFWMAPEVLHTAQTDRSYSGKVDIWSLGCVVIEMWSGKRPWGELEQIPAMMQLFKRMRPPVPDDVHLDDAALDFLNARCLALDPKDRPTAVELLQHKFITKVDPKWTFKDSKIGRNVANTAPRTMSTSTSNATGTGTATVRPGGYI